MSSIDMATQLNIGMYLWNGKNVFLNVLYDQTSVESLEKKINTVLNGRELISLAYAK